MGEIERIPMTVARADFPEIVNRATYQNSRTILTKQGKEAAAVISMKEFRVLQQLDTILDIVEAKAALAEGEEVGFGNWDDLQRELGLSD